MGIRRFQHQTGLVVGLDVGGTKIEATIQNVLEQVGLVFDDVQAIGIGIPGQVEGGTVKRAVNLGIETFPMGRYIQEQVQGVPVVIENDVYTATLGAYRLLNRQKPVRHMLYLGVGTGIAAGVILDGKLYKGAHNMAGEVGHVVVDPNGELCNCGARGCLETIASGPAFTRQAAQAISAGEITSLRDIVPLNARAVFQAARDGDQVACSIVERATFYLAQTIQWLLLCYDVEKVVLGGGIAHEGTSHGHTSSGRGGSSRVSTATSSTMSRKGGIDIGEVTVLCKQC